MVLISIRGSVDTRTRVRPEGSCQWKIPNTPSGIEIATFRLVAECLNLVHHRVPSKLNHYSKIFFLNLSIAFKDLYLPYNQSGLHAGSLRTAHAIYLCCAWVSGKKKDYINLLLYITWSVRWPSGLLNIWAESLHLPQLALFKIRGIS
jgi:hypothetical protein